MFWNWVIYIVIYLGTTFLIVFLIYQIFRVFKRGKIDGWDTYLDLILRILSIIVVPLIIPYFIFAFLNFNVPIGQEILKDNGSEKIEKLSNEIEDLTKSLGNIENLTLNQIQEILSNTLITISVLRDEAINQQNTILRLQQVAEVEMKKADKAKITADNIISLSKEQIEAIKILITNDAKDENIKSFWMGVLISLPIGFTASFLASIFLSKMKRNTGTNTV